MTCNRFIPFKIRWAVKQSTSVDGELILLCETKFSILFYLVRHVHKFDSRIVIK